MHKVFLCREENIGDGLNEKWYNLVWFDNQNKEYVSTHISENVTTLRYYIYDEQNASLWG